MLISVANTTSLARIGKNMTGPDLAPALARAVLATILITRMPVLGIFLIAFLVAAKPKPGLTPARVLIPTLTPAPILVLDATLRLVLSVARTTNSRLKLLWKKPA